MPDQQPRPVVTSELLPCPYDCEPVDPPFVMTDDIPRHYVMCESCGARGPRCQTKRQAITAWNTRASTEHGDVLEAAAAIADRYAEERDSTPDQAEVAYGIAQDIRALAALSTSNADYARGISEVLTQALAQLQVFRGALGLPESQAEQNCRNAIRKLGEVKS